MVGFPLRAQEQSIRTEARRGFQKHVVRFARGEHLQTWEKNQVRPEVVLVNSHDKSSAYQLHCGLFRLVCTNGMVVWQSYLPRDRHHCLSEDSGKLEVAQQIANHESPRTTKLYDRRNDEISLDEIE